MGELLSGGLSSLDLRDRIGRVSGPSKRVKAAAVQTPLVSYEGGWVNRLGVLIGQGDLDINDATKIAQTLPKGEFLLVIPQYWASVYRDAEVIPLECLVRYGSWLIQHQQVRRIRASHHLGNGPTYSVNGTPFEFVEKEELVALFPEQASSTEEQTDEQAEEAEPRRQTRQCQTKVVGVDEFRGKSKRRYVRAS